MLNKEICRNCPIRLKGVAYHLNNYDFKFLSFDAQWKSKSFKCFCDYHTSMSPVLRYKPTYVKINGNIPENCPYSLEHIVSFNDIIQGKEQ